MGSRKASAAEIEARQNRIAEQTKSLMERGKKFRENDEEWQKYLSMATRFYAYSPANCWLILMARDDATAINSFKRWLTLGRSVRKGEKAIWIRAPRTLKAEKTGEDKDRMIFTSVPVFDYAQTDPVEGADYVWEPYMYPALTEDVGSEYVDRLEEALRDESIPIIGFVDRRSYWGRFIDDGGKYSIELNIDRPALAQLNTLVHEMAHWQHRLLDPLQKTGGKEFKELVAEAASHAVLSELGFESDKKSVTYVGLCGEVSEQEEPEAIKIVIKVVAKLMAMLQDESVESKPLAA